MGYSSNISNVIKLTVDELNELGNPDGLLREIASTILTSLKVRVHRDGLASDGQRIGTYSAPYMIVRTGNYKDAAKFKRGERKGQYKDQKRKGEAGTTRDGKARPVYNLPPDPKVIGVLTGQMQNDLKVIGLPDGYGIGYTNDANYEKSQWLEKTYKKPIWALTDGEDKQVDDVTKAYLEEKRNAG